MTYIDFKSRSEFNSTHLHVFTENFTQVNLIFYK